MNLHKLLYRLLYVSAISSTHLISPDAPNQMSLTDRVKDLNRQIEKTNDTLTSKCGEFTLNISVLLDENFTSKVPQWKEQIEGYILFAEQAYSGLFAQKRVVINIQDYGYFQSSSTKVLHILREMYLKQLTKSGNLVVYFTGSDIIGSINGKESSSTIGYADKPGRFSIVEFSPTSHKTFVHEIGHNLGLSHCEDEKSYMFWQAAQGNGFDNISKDILIYMLERYFSTSPVLVSRPTPFKNWLYTKEDSIPKIPVKKQRPVMNPVKFPANKSITRNGEYSRRPRDSLRR